MRRNGRDAPIPAVRYGSGQGVSSTSTDLRVLAGGSAVRLRRALAAARPDAFALVLARSLWVLGNLYGESAQPDPAIETLAEGVRLLTPIFIAVPPAVSEMMAGLVQSYLKQCGAAGREPDAELLGPVIAGFERINAQEDKK